MKLGVRPTELRVASWHTPRPSLLKKHSHMVLLLISPRLTTYRDCGQNIAMTLPKGKRRKGTEKGGWVAEPWRKMRPNTHSFTCSVSLIMHTVHEHIIWEGLTHSQLTAMCLGRLEVIWWYQVWRSWSLQTSHEPRAGLLNKISLWPLSPTSRANEEALSPHWERSGFQDKLVEITLDSDLNLHYLLRKRSLIQNINEKASTVN